MYVTKDSGKKAQYPSGMQRDTTAGKLRYDLIPLWFLTRLAGLYTRGAEKYGDNNWALANSPEELTHFKASAWRHFIQFMNEEEDEDHMAAIVFNVIAIARFRDP